MSWDDRIQDKNDVKILNEIALSLWKKEQTIKYLEEENNKLTDEHFKDIKLKEMQMELDRLHSDCVRGFPITENEQNKIDKIKKEHKEKCLFCNFEYVFECYSIVEFGFLRCTSCGKKFIFYEH